MGATTYRLVRTPAKPYKLEVRPALDLQAASAQAAAWWAQPETIAVVVLEGTREDARYQREAFDESWVPYLWPQRQKTLAEVDLGAAPPVPAVQDAPGPSVGIGDEPEAVAVPSAPQEAPSGGLRCPCCVAPWNGGQPREGERAREATPSGRLEALRCMHCGHPQPGMTRRAIALQYNAMQRAASALHKQKYTPRAGMWR